MGASHAPDFPYLHDLPEAAPLGGGRLQRVAIEFEFRSRGFRDHGHNPACCDLIVCWRHNWPDCPIGVLALVHTIAGLPRGRGR